MQQMRHLPADPDRFDGSAVPAGPAARAAERWAGAVVAALESSSDPKTLEGWSRAISVPLGTLRERCRAAGLSAKASLDFTRLLRAVVWSQRDVWDPHNLLDVIDKRTLKRLLEDGGLAAQALGGAPPDLEAFVGTQQLVR